MDLGLHGKVALVTGGARDIGREISRTLAAEGVTVAVDCALQEKAEATVAEIRQGGGAAAAYAADVADHAAVTRMVDDVVAAHGRLDILVNNAGFLESRLFLETRPEEWTRRDRRGSLRRPQLLPRRGAPHGGAEGRPRGVRQHRGRLRARGAAASRPSPRRRVAR